MILGDFEDRRLSTDSVLKILLELRKRHLNNFKMIFKYFSAEVSEELRVRSFLKVTFSIGFFFIKKDLHCLTLKQFYFIF